MGRNIGLVVIHPLARWLLPVTDMKMFLLLALCLTAIFLWQRHGSSEAAPETTPAVSTSAVAATTPRPVSEHNWAKHSLDRTHEVMDQVSQSRQGEQP